MYTVKVKVYKNALVYTVKALGSPDLVLFRHHMTISGSDLLLIHHLTKLANSTVELLDLARLSANPYLAKFLFYYLLIDCCKRIKSSPKPMAEKNKDYFYLRLKKYCQRLDHYLPFIGKDNAEIQPRLLLRPNASLHSFDYTDFCLPSLYYYLDFLFLWLIRKNERLCRCEVCGSYFVRSKHQQGKLCAYPQKDKVNCTVRRCRNNRIKAKESHTLLKEYERIYKRHYMRMERKINRSFSPYNTPAESAAFRIWSERMHQLRQSYLKREIDPPCFAEKLTYMDKLGAVGQGADFTQQAPETRIKIPEDDPWTVSTYSWQPLLSVRCQRSQNIPQADAEN